MSSSFDPAPSDRLEITKEVGAALTDFDYRIAASLLKLTHALRWPKDTLSYLADRITLEGLMIPISQIVGFTQFTAQVATTIATSETTSSETPTDLATVGPTLTGLPDGVYVLLFGCKAQQSASNSATMAPKINSTEAVDADSASTSSATTVGIMRAVAKTLSNAGNNTVTARYWQTGGAGGVSAFANRWLFALKVENL